MTGERRFLGLYTTTAYHASPREIPILRRKVETVLEKAAFPHGSHNEKALIEILETHPRDEIFQVSVDELFEIAMGILYLGERQRVRLFVRRDTFGRFLSCLVFVPRDRFNTENRRRIESILRARLPRDEQSTTPRASRSRCSCASTTASTSSPAACPSTTCARSRRCSSPPRARGPTTSRAR